MEMKKFKTVFLDAPTLSKRSMSNERFRINGDEFARMTQALIDEMEIDGYEFIQAQTIISATSTISYTEGTLLYFKLNETT